MVLNFPISTNVEERLRRDAAAVGLGIDEYARQLLEKALERPSIDEVLAPYRRQVAERGMSDDEMDAFHRGLLDEVRR